MEDLKDLNKLEEVMYLSLISQFKYKHICDGKVYLCFVPNEDIGISEIHFKPMYITNLEKISEKVLLKRLKTFENKIFFKSYVNYLEENKMVIEGDEKVCYSKRIKDYIKNVYNNSVPDMQKLILDNYVNNLQKIQSEGIIDLEQNLAAIEFVSRQLNKTQEKTC